MKQPDSLDIGTKMDVVRHRLNVAKEDACVIIMTQGRTPYNKRALAI